MSKPESEQTASREGAATNKDAPMGRSEKGLRLYAKLGIAAAVLAAILVLVIFFPVQDYLVRFLTWIDGLGMVGYGVFVALYVLVTVLFMPGFILTVGGGAVFGLAGGFAAVSLGSTVGACCAFLLGRFVAREAVARKVAANPRFAAIDRAVGRQGWKIVFLTRLSPVFPFNMLNYAYGLTRVPFLHYALASWVGMMPGTVVYVYIGSLAGDVARAAVGETPDAGGLELALQGLGLLATIAVTVYITRLARRALREQLPEEDMDGDGAKGTA